MNKEKRLLSITDFTVETKDEVSTFIGMPIVYNRDSDDLGFIERILPGAATEALKNSDIRLLYGHNSESLLPLARSTSGTLVFSETPAGVIIEALAPVTQFARDLAESLRRKDINQMSFSFTVAKDGDSWEKRDGKHIRTIHKINELFDFSFVAYPAYPDTTAAMRSLEQSNNTAIGADGAIVIENENIDVELLLNRYEV